MIRQTVNKTNIMARIEKFIPFLLKWEAGVTPSKGETAEQLFQRARKKGTADDPDDLGGLTVCGVTNATYQHYYSGSVRHITYQQWLSILKCGFWDRWQADSINDQRVAELLVDWVWASGTYGIKIPQRVLGLKADGIVGKQTLAAVNAHNASSLFSQMKRERIAYIDRICHSRPQNKKYRQGWLNRINDL